MLSVYLSCLVVGGGLAIVSAFGELAARRAVGSGRGLAFALRALVYSVAGFGAAGFLIDRLDPDLGSGLTLVLALLAAWLVGGLIVTLLAFLGRTGTGELGHTAGGNHS